MNCPKCSQEMSMLILSGSKRMAVKWESWLCPQCQHIWQRAAEPKKKKISKKKKV